MNPINKRRATTCIALSALLTPVLAQEGLKTTPLGTIDFPPGYRTVMRLAEFAPGTCSGRHTHPGIATDYMLEGETVLKIDGKPDQILKAGDPGQIPAGVPHEYCTTSGLKAVTVHIIEKGKPLRSPAP
jgi:quercetin dioxygenase-like cupin family protein